MVKKGSKRITITLDQEVYDYICGLVGCRVTITDKNNISGSYSLSSKSDVVNKILRHLIENHVSK